MISKISVLQAKSKRQRKSLLVVSTLSLAAFTLRLYQLGGRSLWYDELLQLDIAQGPFSEIGAQLIRHAAMPLDYYLLYSWVRLGRQDAWVRFPALVFGVLAIPLIYALGKRLFTRSVGYIAATLLTFTSFAVSYSQEVRPYALLMSLVIVTYLGFWLAYRTLQMRYWVVAIAGLTGAVLSHYFALFMLLPLALFVAVKQLYYFKQPRFWQNTALFSVATVFLIFLLILNGRLPTLYSVGHRFVKESYQLEKYSLPAGEKINRGSGPPITLNFFIEKVLVPLGASKPSILLLYNLFFLTTILSLLDYQHSARSAILLLLAWLILPVLLIYAFLLHRGTFFAIRYILYTLPAYLLLVACGIDRLADYVGHLISSLFLRRISLISKKMSFASTRLLRAGFIGVTLLLLSMAQFNQLLTLYAADSREDWRVVGQMLQAEAGPDDIIIAIRAEPTMSWYYPPAATPFGHYGRSQPIWEAMTEHRRRWFVLSSYSFKRDEGLRDWLRNQGAVTIAVDRRVVVHFHEEGKSRGEMLAEVKAFSLPQKAITYQVLADQFQQQGDLETSQAFYKRADELARVASNRGENWANLSSLFGLLQLIKHWP